MKGVNDDQDWINTDNWRHLDKPVEYCFEVIAKQGIEFCELEAVGGTEFFTGLGFAPFIPLDSDPLDLRKKLDKYGLKVSQLDVSFPINRWSASILSGVGYFSAATSAYRVWIPPMASTNWKAFLTKNKSTSSNITCNNACQWPKIIK